MSKRLTQKQSKALPLLAAGMTGAATAETVGVKASTVSEWINHCPAFAVELDRLRDQIKKDAIDHLQASARLAAGEIRRIITKGKSEALRLRASEYVIDNFALPGVANQPNHSNLDATGNRLNLALVLEGLGVRNAT